MAGTRTNVVPNATAFRIALRTNPACILSNWTGVLACGYGTFGTGTPIAEHNCSHPNPSSRLNVCSFSFGMSFFTCLFLFIERQWEHVRLKRHEWLTILCNLFWAHAPLYLGANHATMPYGPSNGMSKTCRHSRQSIAAVSVAKNPHLWESGLVCSW